MTAEPAARLISSTPAVLASISAVLSHAASTADASPPPYEALSSYHALQPPAIPLSAYVARVSKYAFCSNAALVAAAQLAARLCETEVRFSGLSAHRIFLAASVVAAKFHDDTSYNLEYYGKVGGVPVGELRALEVGLLKALGWRVGVSVDEFKGVEERLIAAAASVPGDVGDAARAALLEAGIGGEGEYTEYVARFAADGAMLRVLLDVEEEDEEAPLQPPLQAPHQVGRGESGWGPVGERVGEGRVAERFGDGLRVARGQGESSSGGYGTTSAEHFNSGRRFDSVGRFDGGGSGGGGGAFDTSIQCEAGDDFQGTTGAVWEKASVSHAHPPTDRRLTFAVARHREKTFADPSHQPWDSPLTDPEGFRGCGSGSSTSHSQDYASRLGDIPGSSTAVAIRREESTTVWGEGYKGHERRWSDVCVAPAHTSKPYLPAPFPDYATSHAWDTSRYVPASVSECSTQPRHAKQHIPPSAPDHTHSWDTSRHPAHPSHYYPPRAHFAAHVYTHPQFSAPPSIPSSYYPDYQPAPISHIPAAEADNRAAAIARAAYGGLYSHTAQRRSMW